MRASVQGTLSADTVTVDSTDVLELVGDFAIEARGNIYVEGKITPASGTTGAGLKLKSTEGRIYISGQIQTADGEFGDDKDGVTNVVGGDGTAGGDIAIIAEKGSVIIEAGATLRSGDGGWGGDATAHGPAALVSADSGKGGDAGTIIITARHQIDVFGEVRGGEGGPAGDAVARYKPAAGEDGAQPPGLVKATAHPGGHGGDILFVLNTPGRGSIRIDGIVRGGRGSSTGSAHAGGGVRAEATALKAGRGGNVDVQGGPRVRVVGTAKEIRGGDGGLCEKAGELAAVAHGETSAQAQTSDGTVPAGGDAGVVAAPIFATNDAEAGDSGDTKATAMGATKTGQGGAHVKTAPGKASTASAP